MKAILLFLAASFTFSMAQAQFVTCPNWQNMDLRCKVWDRVCPEAHAWAVKNSQGGGFITCFKESLPLPAVCLEGVKEEFCPLEQ